MGNLVGKTFHEGCLLSFSILWIIFHAMIRSDFLLSFLGNVSAFHIIGDSYLCGCHLLQASASKIRWFLESLLNLLSCLVSMDQVCTCGISVSFLAPAVLKKWSSRVKSLQIACDQTPIILPIRNCDISRLCRIITKTGCDSLLDEMIIGNSFVWLFSGAI